MIYEPNEKLNKVSADEQKKQLFLQQKQTLDTFLKNGAITKKQYDKSFGDLREKMGMHDVE